LEETHLEQALGRVCVQDGSFSLVLGVVRQSQAELIVAKSLNILLFLELIVPSSSDLLCTMSLQRKLRLHSDMVRPSDEQSGFLMHIDLVGALESDINFKFNYSGDAKARLTTAAILHIVDLIADEKTSKKIQKRIDSCVNYGSENNAGWIAEIKDLYRDEL